MPVFGGLILPHFSLVTYRVMFEQKEQRRAEMRNPAREEPGRVSSAHISRIEWGKSPHIPHMIQRHQDNDEAADKIDRSDSLHSTIIQRIADCGFLISD